MEVPMFESISSAELVDVTGGTCASGCCSSCGPQAEQAPAETSGITNRAPFRRLVIPKRPGLPAGPIQLNR
jgi:hypothetical protein